MYATEHEQEVHEAFKRDVIRLADERDAWEWSVTVDKSVHCLDALGLSLGLGGEEYGAGVVA